MTENKYHVFSDGKMHIAYDRNEMIFYVIDDETWNNPDELLKQEPKKDSAPPLPRKISRIQKPPQILGSSNG